MNTTTEPNNGDGDARQNSFVGRSLTRQDRNLILALEKAIDDPATPEAMRAEYRGELGDVAMSYIDVLDPEEEREFLAKLNPADLLTEEEWKEFVNRKRPSRGPSSLFETPPPDG